jgi:hypothetical protein
MTMQTLSQLGAIAKARLSGRSWWAVRFVDGTEWYEFQSGADWLHLTERGQRGLVEVRLYCPNGQVAVLGGPDLAGRCFQLHGAQVNIGGGTRGRYMLWQAIGRKDAPDGTCTLYAWEPQPGRLVGPLVDNIHQMRYGGNLTGAGLCLDVLGVRL